MKKALLLFVSFVCLCSFTANKTSEAENYYNYGIPLSQLIPQPYSPNGFSILVQKSSYTLFLKYNGRLIKSYPCVFGPDPIGDKRRQGDNRTPEGNFTIIDIREHFIWGYFLEIDYPNHHSWDKHNKAKFYREIPDTSDIGGDIGLHGVVDGWESYIDTKNNWTEGCVSLKNIDVIELANHIAIGTPIKIVY